MNSCICKDCAMKGECRLLSEEERNQKIEECYGKAEDNIQE